MSRTSHIAVVVNDLHGYGAQRVAVDLGSALARTGRRITLITLERPKPGELTVPAGVERVLVERTGRGPLSYILTSWQLRRAVSRVRPDAVIANMTFSNLVALLGVPRRTPVVAVEHNVLTRNLVIERSPRSIALLVHLLYPRARKVVGVSDDVVDDLVENHGVRRESAQRIYNPLPRSGTNDPGSSGPGGEAPHPWLAQGRAGKTAVLVGGLRRAKGHRVAIEAMAELAGVDDQWRLLCVGDGPLREELTALVEDHLLSERIELVGHVDDPRGWMARADAVIIPSLWEGFGLVAVEAATVGTPVIASDAVGLRELVPRYVKGRRVAAGSASALAAELRFIAEGGVLDGPLETLAVFDPDHVARRYLAALGDAAPTAP